MSIDEIVELAAKAKADEWKREIDAGRTTLEAIEAELKGVPL